MRSYHAKKRVQIRIVPKQHEDSGLCQHEDNGDGTPLCNRPLRDFEGRPAVYVATGPGPVDCGHCARNTKRAEA
jgi:hypothetical protein